MTTPTTIVVTPSESEDTPIAAGSARNSTSSLRSRLREIPPPIGLPPRLNSHEAPMFTSSDEPPPYSPTHTILPHYFELEPIPVRTYIIKDSTGLPCLFDFWLISTTQSSSSRPQSLLLVQDRGLSPQHQAELKYSIIRPQHTDRTAFPVTGATDTYFSPALALVAARLLSESLSASPEIVIQDNLPLSEQESAMDNAIDAAAATGAVEDGDNVDDDDDEAGFYHCREESSTGFLGRIVAVYKPGRPANRARDRPASSRKLEIFTEVGERCETALMLMCTRLDDLFMSLPVQKREQMFVTSRAGAGHSSGSRDGTASGGQSLSTAAGVNGNVFDGSNEPTEGEQERGDGLDLGGQDRHGQTSAPTFSVLLKKRLVGTPRDWLFRFKWIIAAILITVVLVLVLKPKHPPHD
ncbi:hypothetical protein FBU30_004468 [Linnemannia zychae]|nr:hypothetical protein FBU30_004468 [Linnemannia zychae]